MIRVHRRHSFLFLSLLALLGVNREAIQVVSPKAAPARP